MVSLDSKQDSDRIIRELMVKSKDLQFKFEKASLLGAGHAAIVSKLEAELGAALKENRDLAGELQTTNHERDALDLVLVQTPAWAVQDSALKALREKHSKTKDKNAMMKENNKILSNNVTQLQEDLALQESNFTRSDRQQKLELARLTQERDGFSDQTVTLRDKVSQLARELAEGEDSGKALTCRIVKLQQTIDELQQAACDAQRAWKHERILLEQEAGGATPLSVQDRDGCKTQLEALRDKISSLSRELATHEDAETDKDAAICGLKGNIIGLEDTVQSLQKHSAGLQGQLEAAWAEASDTAARMTDRHAEVALLREQAGSVARAWKHEQLLLVQERDGFKSQLESLRNKISTLSRQLADGEDCKTGKEQQVSELEVEVEDLRSLLATAQHTLSAAQSQIVAEEAALAEACSAHAQLQSDYTAKKVAWNTTRGQLVSDRDGYKCQVHTLQDKVAEMSRLCALKEDSSIAKEALASQLQQECRDLRGQLEVCEGRASTALYSLQGCERKVLACEGDLQACRSALQERENKLGQSVEELARAQAKSEKEKAAWKGERAQLVSDRDGYKGQMNTLRDKVSELANQLAIALEPGEKLHGEEHSKQVDMASQLMALTSQLKEKTTSLAGLKLKLEQQACRADAAESANGSLHKQHEHLKLQLETQCTELQSAQQHTASLQEAQRSLDQQLEEQLRQLRDAQAMTARLRQHATDLQVQIAAKSAALADAEQRECTQKKQINNNQKAWKSERLILIGERDGALSQVSALRGKISHLARGLAEQSSDRGGSSECVGAQSAAVSHPDHVEARQLHDDLQRVKEVAEVAEASVRDVEVERHREGAGLQERLAALQATVLSAKHTLHVKEAEWASEKRRLEAVYADSTGRLHGLEQKVHHLKAQLVTSLNAGAPVVVLQQQVDNLQGLLAAERKVAAEVPALRACAVELRRRSEVHASATERAKAALLGQLAAAVSTRDAAERDRLGVADELAAAVCARDASETARASLVDELAQAVQTRDNAVSAAKRLENLAVENDAKSACMKAHAEELRAQLDAKVALVMELQRQAEDLEESVAAAELSAATAKEALALRASRASSAGQLQPAGRGLAETSCGGIATAGPLSAFVGKESSAARAVKGRVEAERTHELSTALQAERAARTQAQEETRQAQEAAEAQSAAWRAALAGLRVDQEAMIHQWTEASAAWEEEREALVAEVESAKAQLRDARLRRSTTGGVAG